MEQATVRLTVKDTINGQPWEVSMRYPRACWYDVDDRDREELRMICRYRFSSWARSELGLELPAGHVDALSVTVA